MKLLYIQWVDATSNSGWFDKTEIDKWITDDFGVIDQVGWLYKETKEYIILLGRLSDSEKKESGFGQLQKIPKTWIRKRKTLTITK